MSDKTGIAWTEATWNPVTGCTKVSAGCKHCYAERDWPRFYGKTEVIVPLPQGHVIDGVRLTEVLAARPFTHVLCHEDRLDTPIRWKRPRKIFVNSMSDLFHENVPDQFIDQVFATMALCHRHTFQILTKRPERMQSYLADEHVTDRIWAHAIRISGEQIPVDWPLSHVWIGVSVEDQAAAEDRIPLLLQTPAAIRWVSAEPLLGPIDLSKYLSVHHEVPALNWIVIGGESGPKSRRFDLDWARCIIRQCANSNTVCFMKQLGTKPGYHSEAMPPLWHDLSPLAGGPHHRSWADPSVWPDDLRVRNYPDLAFSLR
ncbi:MAG: DUF5131 family protein [Acidiferrobacteraceae bacterium]